MIRKGKVYKVWIDIEEYDVKSGDGTMLDCLTIGCAGTFRTEEDAERFATDLQARAETLAGKRVTHI